MEFQQGNNMTVCGPPGYSSSNASGQPQMTSAGIPRVPSGSNNGVNNTNTPNIHTYTNQDYSNQQYRPYNTNYPPNYPPQEYGQAPVHNRFPQNPNYQQCQSPTLNQLLQQNNSQSNRNTGIQPGQPNYRGPYEPGHQQYQNPAWNQGKPIHTTPTSNSIPGPDSSQSPQNYPSYNGPPNSRFNESYGRGPSGAQQNSYPPNQASELTGFPDNTPVSVGLNNQNNTSVSNSVDPVISGASSVNNSMSWSSTSTPQSTGSTPMYSSSNMSSSWQQQQFYPGFQGGPPTSMQQSQSGPQQIVTEPISPEPTEDTSRPHSRVSDSGRISAPGSSSAGAIAPRSNTDTTGNTPGFRGSPAPPHTPGSRSNTPAASGGGGGGGVNRNSPMPPRPPSSSQDFGPMSAPSSALSGGAPPGSQPQAAPGSDPSMAGPPYSAGSQPPAQQCYPAGMVHPGYNMMPQHRSQPPGGSRPPHHAMHSMYPHQPPVAGKPMPPYHSGPPQSYPPRGPPQPMMHPGGQPGPPQQSTHPSVGGPQQPQSSQASSQSGPPPPGQQGYMMPPPPGYHHQQQPGYLPYSGHPPPHHPTMYGPQGNVGGMEQYRVSPGGTGRPGQPPMRPHPGSYPPAPPGSYPMSDPSLPPHSMNGPTSAPHDSIHKKDSENSLDSNENSTRVGSGGKSKSSGMQKQSDGYPATPGAASPSQNSMSSYHDEMETMLSSPPHHASSAPPTSRAASSASPGSIQKLYEMGPEPDRRQWVETYLSFMEEIGKALSGLPQVAKTPLDLYRFYMAVRERGGLMDVMKSKRWKEISQFVNVNASASAAYTLRKNYVKYLLDYECRFDRGNIDPRPIIQQIEAMSGKKKKKPPSSPQSGSGPERPNSASLPGSNDYCMDYPPGPPPPQGSHHPSHYMQNGQPPPRGYPMGSGVPYTNGHPLPSGAMLPPRGPPYGSGPPVNWRQGYMGPGIQQPPQHGPGGPPPMQNGPVSTSSGPLQGYPSSMQPQQHQMMQGGQPRYPSPYMHPNSQYHCPPPPNSSMPPPNAIPPPQVTPPPSSSSSQQQVPPNCYPPSPYPLPPNQQPPSSQRPPISQSGSLPPSSSQPPLSSGSPVSSCPQSSTPSSSTPSPAASSANSMPSSGSSQSTHHLQPPNSSSSHQSIPSGTPPTSRKRRTPGSNLPSQSSKRHSAHFQSSTGGDSVPMHSPNSIHQPSKRPEALIQMLSNDPRHPDQWSSGPLSSRGGMPPPPAPPSSIANCSPGGGIGMTRLPPQMSPQQSRGMPHQQSSQGHHSMMPHHLHGHPPGTHMGQVPHPELMGRMHSQKSGYVAAVYKRQEVSPFPPNSIEATMPVLTKRKRYAYKDVCPLVPWKLYMGLKSGLPAEVTWALDCLNILLRDDTTFQYFGLSYLPGLLDSLLEIWQHALAQVFTLHDHLTTSISTDSSSITTLTLSIEHNHSTPSVLNGIENSENVVEDNKALTATVLKKLVQGKNGMHLQLKDLLDRGRNFPSQTRHGMAVRLEKTSKGPFSRLNESELISFLMQESRLKSTTPEDNQKADISSCSNTCHIQPGLESDAPNCLKEIFFSKQRWNRILEESKKGEQESVKIKKEEVSDDKEEINGLENGDSEIEEDINETEDEPKAKRVRKEDSVEKGEHKDASIYVQFKAKEEMCLDGEPPVYTVSDHQETAIRRCICIVTVLRNLSFLPQNEQAMATNNELLASIGCLLLRGHQHFNDWPDPLVCHNWWQPWIEQLRENALVTFCNLSGQIKLQPLPETIVRPLLEGIIHWLCCNSAASLDPFPGQNVISPRRLALETLTKLCVHDDNVELVFATPSPQDLERLFNNLSSMIASGDQVIREMSLALCNYLVRSGDGGGALMLARAQPCVISTMLDFLECTESSARRVIDTMGMEALQAKPELMGTSLELVRRVGSILEVLASVEANMPQFTAEHQNRLLMLVMSKVLDQNVAQSVAGVLYRLPAIPSTGPPAILPDLLPFLPSHVHPSRIPLPSPLSATTTPVPPTIVQ